jgi:hypothetical protein
MSEQVSVCTVPCPTGPPRFLKAGRKRGWGSPWKDFDQSVEPTMLRSWDSSTFGISTQGSGKEPGGTVCKMGG